MRSLEDRTGAVVLKEMEKAGVPLNEWTSAAWRGLKPVPVRNVTRQELDLILARGGVLLCSPALHRLGWISVWDGEAFCIAWLDFSPTGESPPPLMVPSEMEPFES